MLGLHRAGILAEGFGTSERSGSTAYAATISPPFGDETEPSRRMGGERRGPPCRGRAVGAELEQVREKLAALEGDLRVARERATVAEAEHQDTEAGQSVTQPDARRASRLETSLRAAEQRAAAREGELRRLRHQNAQLKRDRDTLPDSIAAVARDRR